MKIIALDIGSSFQKSAVLDTEANTLVPVSYTHLRYTPVKKAEKMAIKSRNSNSGPRKKPMASLKRLMIYSTKSIKEHTILTCGRTRFNIYDHSPSPT